MKIPRRRPGSMAATGTVTRPRRLTRARLIAKLDLVDQDLVPPIMTIPQLEVTRRWR